MHAHNGRRATGSKLGTSILPKDTSACRLQGLGTALAPEATAKVESDCFEINTNDIAFCN